MKIFVGADYRGFDRKTKLVEFLSEAGLDVADMGAFEKVEGDDFNDPAIKVAQAIRKNPGSYGILICDSAHGVTMQANRFKGIRAAHCDTIESAKLAREHDAANVLCLSAHFLDDEKIKEITRAFLTTNFEPLDRRARRIKRLDERNDYDS